MFKLFFARATQARDGVRRSLALSLSLALLPGCAMVPPLPPVNLQDAGWTVREGQAVYCQKKGVPEIAGELLVASRADGRAFVQFSKTPFPVVVAQSTHNSWEVQLPMENKRYSGKGQPPKRLIFLYLPKVLVGQPPPQGWEWKQLEGKNWRLENPQTGESLEGYLLE